MINSIIRTSIGSQFNIELSLQILSLLAALTFSCLSTFLLERYTAKRFNKSRSGINIILPVIATAGLIISFGYSIETVKGFILFLLLLFASNSDLQTREVDDYIPIMIGVTALIGVSFSDLPMMFLSAFVISLPQVLIAILKPNTYGGADIKIMAACAFLLGIGKGLFAIIIGLSLAVIVTALVRKMKKQDLKVSFALVPYLAVGSFIGYLI